MGIADGRWYAIRPIVWCIAWIISLMAQQRICGTEREGFWQRCLPGSAIRVHQTGFWRNAYGPIWGAWRPAVWIYTQMEVALF
jgi:hypothetical protein